MRILVLYYSFTGNTRMVSQLLAKELDADLAEFTCKAYSYSPFGGLRQGWHVLTGGSPSIERPNELDQAYDLVVVAGPVWAARPAPPLRSLVKQFQSDGRKLALFLTCDGTSEKYPGEKALEEIVNLLPTKPAATHLFKRADIEGTNLKTTVKSFAEEIRKA